MELNFDKIEKSIGGRPAKKNGTKKIRKSFYVNEEENRILNSLIEKRDTSVSSLVRELIVKEGSYANAKQ